ncbi:LETM1-related biofilm-associated protein [Ascidiimonas aurantiaca]|uniref:LETM1-related biofilm-associated protein n=1 Tax=Ascidiimonas aurantiaca TaxID=1685432 RepID=UPI0030EC6E86
MNPSASGWIDKLITILSKDCLMHTERKVDFYEGLRASGFIYGANVKTVPDLVTQHTLSEDEITKVNLLTALLYYYSQKHPDTSLNQGIEVILNFYEKLNARNFNFLEKILIGKRCSSQLEKLLDSRIRITGNLITKNFNNLITNALLYSDVLAFIRYLNKEDYLEQYAIQLEKALTHEIFEALNSKEKKSEYDELLIRLVESSLRYQELSQTEIQEETGYSPHLFNSREERMYMMDLACMALWGDVLLDPKEESYLQSLCQKLSISSEEMVKSLEHIRDFIHRYEDRISFFQSTNPVKAFYDQSSKTVTKLILRNKKRLLQELSESGELMVLLTRSSVKELNIEEKRRMRKLLIDLCKSIPSLAVFALPGGAVLLPLLVKFIPTLLPSAFDENRITEE